MQVATRLNVVCRQNNTNYDNVVLYNVQMYNVY